MWAWRCQDVTAESRTQFHGTRWVLLDPLELLVRKVKLVQLVQLAHKGRPDPKVPQGRETVLTRSPPDRVHTEILWGDIHTSAIVAVARVAGTCRTGAGG